MVGEWPSIQWLYRVVGVDDFLDRYSVVGHKSSNTVEWSSLQHSELLGTVTLISELVASL